MLLWPLYLLAVLACVVALLRLARVPRGVKILHPHYPIIGMMPTLSRNIDNFPFWSAEMATQNGDKPWGGVVPGLRFVFITSAEAVEHILKTSFDTFVKGQQFFENLEELLGRGIFSVDGEEWKSQRRVASHLFKTRTLKTAMEESFVSHGKEFMKIIDQKAATGEAFNIQELFLRYTFDTICDIGFGFHLGALHSEGNTAAMNSFDRIQNVVACRFRIPPFVWKLQRLLGMGTEGKLKGDAKILNKFLDGLVKTRTEQIAMNKDDELVENFLTLFIKSELKQGRQPSPVFLRDIVASFLIAGRDTTACTLTTMIKMLAEHPEVDQKLVEEINTELLPSDDAYPSYTHLTKRGGKYIGAVLNEVLRWQPPVPMDSKLCTKSCVLPDGTPIEAGTTVFYSPYFMGRKESYWGPDVLEFKPERWLNREPPTPYENPVFNAGPRTCLGIHMANFEAKLLAAMVLKKYRFKLQPNQDFTLLGGAVTFYKNGVMVTAEERK